MSSKSVSKSMSVSIKAAAAVLSSCLMFKTETFIYTPTQKTPVTSLMLEFARVSDVFNNTFCYLMHHYLNACCIYL